jgi:uncharacterized protein YjbJ (UPF0337 family)
MSPETFKGKWNQVQGDMKVWWGKLSDNDIRAIEGSRDRLADILQTRYGYDRERAEEEIDQHFGYDEEDMDWEKSLIH